jgi:hypothetical protein
VHGGGRAGGARSRFAAGARPRGAPGRPAISRGRLLLSPVDATAGEPPDSRLRTVGIARLHSHAGFRRRGGADRELRPHRRVRADAWLPGTPFRLSRAASAGRSSRPPHRRARVGCAAGGRRPRMARQHGARRVSTEALRRGARVLRSRRLRFAAERGALHAEAVRRDARGDGRRDRGRRRGPAPHGSRDLRLALDRALGDSLSRQVGRRVFSRAARQGRSRSCASRACRPPGRSRRSSHRTPPTAPCITRSSSSTGSRPGRPRPTAFRSRSARSTRSRSIGR